MYKKACSILMVYLALAIMLGHSFIEHKHYDDEHSEKSAHHHHHANEEHHHDTNTEDENENDSQDWGRFFSIIQHSTHEPTYLSSRNSAEYYSVEILKLTAQHCSIFTFRQITIEVWQNAPPFKEDLYFTLNSLPNGLRAPPTFSV